MTDFRPKKCTASLWERQFATLYLFPAYTGGGGSEKVFASQERVSGFPEKGLTSGEVRETFGEVRGTSGEVRETSGEPLGCCKVPQCENFQGSRRKTSGEVWGTSGEVRGLPGKLGGAWLPPSDSPNLSPNWGHNNYSQLSYFRLSMMIPITVTVIIFPRN